MSLRLFIAIDIHQQLAKRLADVQSALRRLPELKPNAATWVRPEQMHLTLKFLGAVEPSRLTKICGLVQEIALQHKPFDIVCRGIGAFGSPARVLWAGFEPSEPLEKLQAELDKRLTEAGCAAENRAYSAHLTLCRIKSAAAGSVLKTAAQKWASELFGTVNVDAVVVYESRLSAKGPDYLTVSRSPLGIR